MRVGDLVRWRRFDDDYSSEFESNDYGVVLTFDIYELSDDEQTIVGVWFMKIGFVWVNYKSIEVVSANHQPENN